MANLLHPACPGERSGELRQTAKHGFPQNDDAVRWLKGGHNNQIKHCLNLPPGQHTLLCGVNHNHAQAGALYAAFMIKQSHVILSVAKDIPALGYKRTNVVMSTAKDSSSNRKARFSSE